MLEAEAAAVGSAAARGRSVTRHGPGLSAMFVCLSSADGSDLSGLGAKDIRHAGLHLDFSAARLSYEKIKIVKRFLKNCYSLIIQRDLKRSVFTPVIKTL